MSDYCKVEVENRQGNRNSNWALVSKEKVVGKPIDTVEEVAQDEEGKKEDKTGRTACVYIS